MIQPTQPFRRQQSGFTLTELLIALAVFGILLGLALPGYQSSVQATRSTSVRSELVNSIQIAINQSILTGTRAVLCPSVDGTSCASGADWTAGWIGYMDNNGNRERQPDERLVHVQPALPDGVHLTTSAGRTRLVFQASGSNGGSNVRFTICDRRGPAKAQSLVLNNRGRLHAADPDPARVAATCES